MMRAGEAEADDLLGTAVSTSNGRDAVVEGNTATKEAPASLTTEALHHQAHNHTAVQVRRRLAVCLFLYISGVSVVTQIYPKVLSNLMTHIVDLHQGVVGDSLGYEHEERATWEGDGEIFMVVLDYFEDDDAKASTFNGWLTLASSAAQFIAVPSMSSASDVIGRRVVLALSLAVNGAAVLALGIQPNSIVAVTACQLVSGVCTATLPVSQAIIVDVSQWGEGADISHGLGIVGATFGLAIIIGPLVGGTLSDTHRSLGCALGAGISLLALLSLRFYGWEETAPGRRLATAEPGRSGRCTCPAFRFVNPVSIFKILLENSVLVELSVCLFGFQLALNVYTVYYNLLDYRYHWGPLNIAVYFSVFGVLLALMSGVGIRLLVPKRLSEEQGVRTGLAFQALAHFLVGLARRGWMLFPIALGTVVQYITEPCIQAIMARLVEDHRQGNLQGAVASLRIVAQGLAAPVYGEIFSFGLSDTIKKVLGSTMPGLPLFLAAQFSMLAWGVAWCALRSLHSPSGPRTASWVADEMEEGFGTASRLSTEIGDSVSATDAVGAADQESMSEMSEPLLSDPAQST